LPFAVSVPATVTALMVSAALPVMGAVLENEVAALKLAAAFAVKSALVVRVAAEVRVVGELTVTLLLASVPRTTLPVAVRVLPATTVKEAFAVSGAVKLLAALTVN